METALACWGDHFDVDKALSDRSYCKAKRTLLKKYGLKVFAISTQMVGQAVCDNIDERHKAILPPDVWGDGDPEGVRKRAAQKVIDAAKAAKKLGVKVVNGFTGSPIWHMLYSFPPASPEAIQAGYDDFGRRWRRILNAFKTEGVKFALEVHPTEIAFDIVSARRRQQATSSDSFVRNRGSHFAGTGDRKMVNKDPVDPGFHHTYPSMTKCMASYTIDGGSHNSNDPTVFVPYSHKDELWKDLLVTHLGVLQKQGRLHVWDDSRIGPGMDWYPEIEKAINRSSVALPMITANFLTSDFILNEEIPRLLERRQKEGLCVLPIIVKPCAWQQVDWLSSMNVRPKDGNPISGGTEYDIDAQFAVISEEVASIIQENGEVARRKHPRLHLGVSEVSTKSDEVIDALVGLVKALEKNYISRGGNGFNINVVINTHGLTKGCIQ